MNKPVTCELCGEPMPVGEEMFKFHGYSGPCPKPPLPTVPPPDTVSVRVEWSLCGNKKPNPHARYVVLRDGFYFTATPCYGMHSPWWVGRTLGDRLPGWYETDPVNMRDDDKWIPVDDFSNLLAALLGPKGGQ